MCTAFNFRKPDIAFLFTTRRDMGRYHKRFLNNPSPTDVITFADKEGVDIVISLDQAARQARPRGLSLVHEVQLLMCHALLHAAGFDDRTEKDWLKMRRAEFETMARLLP